MEDALACEIMKLRYFAGLTGVPQRELNSQWAFARAWLRDVMEE